MVVVRLLSFKIPETIKISGNQRPSEIPLPKGKEINRRSDQNGKSEIRSEWELVKWAHTGFALNRSASLAVNDDPPQQRAIFQTRRIHVGREMSACLNFTIKQQQATDQESQVI